MLTTHHPISFPAWRALLVATVVALAGSPAQAQQRLSADDLLSGIVHIKTAINPDGRTLKNLGREREGSGMVIDGNGLILTIGYLMVEAHSAEVTTSDGRSVPADVVGYDHESGFGLLRAVAPLKARPVAFGKSDELKEGDRVLAASWGGPEMVAAVHVVAKREYAGSWEYLLDEAIFTAPAHSAWSGAALLNREGRLVGVGSLIVHNVTQTAEAKAGNMFVPIDRLPPILGDLIATGRVAGPGRPWLGVNTDEMRGHLVISNVTRDGPAEQAGLRRGDIILGVNGHPQSTLASFYREVWATGRAGVMVALDVLQGGDKRRVEIKSMNRLDHLRLKSTF
jgi:S1-C subfamily serine protease